jgi:hypothetical protein
MVFDCEIKENQKISKWKGRIKRFTNYGSHYEIFIESRSSIMVIFGKTSRGNFACIPDFGAGCHLIELKNKFWNTEKLVSVMGKVDGLTVASALSALSDLHEF